MKNINMSVSAKASKERQRNRVNKMSMKEYFENKTEYQQNPVTRDENKCIHCGFKAKYVFIRCPECNEHINYK